MNLRRKLGDITFCSLDLETTGVNPAIDKIVEIGVSRFTLNGGFETFSTLVDPGVLMPPSVVNIHGITDAMVAGAPAIDDVLDDLRGFVNNSIPVIQNPRFDLSFLSRAYSNAGGKPPFFSAIDTVRLAQKYFTGLPNHKLSTLAFHLGLKLSSHRALDDSIACMKVFLAVIRGRGLTEASSLYDLLNIHGEMVKPAIRIERGRGVAVWKSISIGEKVSIKYEDSNGQITSRDILPREFINYGKKNYILAHCFLRNSERCFMTSRILCVK
jgi:DNA polymerase III epsilon subunit family exonuclease